MKRRLISLTAAFILTAAMLSTSVFAAEPAITVTVNGAPVAFTDAFPFIDGNNRTLVPLRAAADALGIEVEWDAENRTALFERSYTMDNAPKEAFFDVDGDGVDDAFYSYRYAAFEADSTLYETGLENTPTGEWKPGIIEASGGEMEMDTAAVIVGGRMYAPIRYLANQFDYDAVWDGNAHTVKLLAEQPYRYHYYYPAKEDLSDGVFSLGLANVDGLVGASITKILARVDGDPAGGTIDVAFDKGADQKLIDEAAGNGHAFLDGIHANYRFENGHNYEFTVSFNGTKTNGATFTDHFYVRYEFT
jgi:hypothetical protein